MIERNNQFKKKMKRNLDNFFGKKGKHDDNETNIYIPLAEKMRPQSLEDIIGQEEVIGRGTPFNTMILDDKYSSTILYGPPGCGKTSIASIIKRKTEYHFVQLSAVSCSKTEIKEEIEKARERKKKYKKTILFIDEIHLLNKKQQEDLTTSVKNKTIVLIGSTSENPSFQLNYQLRHACNLVVMKQLNERDLKRLIQKCLLKYYPKITLSDECYNAITTVCDGDGRKCMNILEKVLFQYSLDENQTHTIELKDIQEHLTFDKFRYDKKSEEHYNLISAFQKSIRGSDEDASIYWLYRMLLAGEQPEYISRRMMKIASEDVGFGDINATFLTQSIHETIKILKGDEVFSTLAMGVLYLARAHKSNALEMTVCVPAENITKHYPIPINVQLVSEHCKNDSKMKFVEDEYAIDYLPQQMKGNYKICYDNSLTKINKEDILPSKSFL